MVAKPPVFSSLCLSWLSLNRSVFHIHGGHKNSHADKIRLLVCIFQFKQPRFLLCLDRRIINGINFIGKPLCDCDSIAEEFVFKFFILQIVCRMFEVVNYICINDVNIQE